MVNNEKQCYFETQEKLEAISRVRAGEAHLSVARSMGISSETLQEWMSTVARADYNQGGKMVSTLDYQLLDNALYTWFTQQLGKDIRPTRDGLKRYAEVFSTRLYGNYEGIVSDLWIEKWQNRHHIQEKQEQYQLEDFDLICVDDVVNGFPKAEDNKENRPVFYECDFKLDEAVNSVLVRHVTQQAVEKDFVDLKMRIGKLNEEIVQVNDSFEFLENYSSEIRASFFATLGKECGLGKPSSGSDNREVGKDGEVVHIGQKSLERQHLWPFGPIERRKLQPNMHVYSMKTDLMGVWIKSIILEVIPETKEGNDQNCDMYRVKFKINKKPVIKVLSAKQLAYASQPMVTLPVGTRVIAQYKDEVSPHLNALYAGIIAEPPKLTNNQRYLVFFDDTYAQYVRHNELRLVCESSKEVWRDIHEDFQDYIKTYLEKYPERPMVKVQEKQVVKIEWNGSWWSAVVLTVDASLVHMCFEADKRTEWIYRGSPRLAPLHKEQTDQEENRVTSKIHRSGLKRKHKPSMKHTAGLEEQTENENSDDQAARGNGSTGKISRRSASLSSEDGSKTENGPPQMHALSCMKSQEGVISSDKLAVTSVPVFVPHTCCSACNYKEEERLLRGQNPLRIPMLCGWLRQLVKQRTKKIVYYNAPCGRRLRCIEEVFRYLTRTKSKLGIDLFSFDVFVHTFAQFKPSGILSFIKDITYGKESVPVCLVNNLSTEYAPPIAYSSKRFPREGVEINTDPEFLCGCDCEDNCQNKEKCQCQQLTVNATAASSSGEINPDAGYNFRRLGNKLFTGIYECNTRCKCKSTCLNRVVQNGLQVRLQVFKTEHKGWGIRCLDDLPQGIFICIYAGQVSNDDGAEADEKEFGDAYHADIDHIEVVEKNKEGYESDVEGDDLKEEEENEEAESSDENNSESDMPVKTSVYECDLDYEPGGGKWASSDDDENDNKCNNNNNNKRLRNSRLSSRSSDSSVTSNDRQQKLRAREATKHNRRGSEMEGLNNTSVTTSRRRSSSRIRNPENDAVSTKPDANNRPKPLRSHFGEEYCYILDATRCGNIGRYLNHSCSPNLFVQNVFVDTHDLRFPWLAFFASYYIRAGTELTWDYSYKIGSVPGKVLQCFCCAKGCRRRLL